MRKLSKDERLQIQSLAVKVRDYLEPCGGQSIKTELDPLHWNLIVNEICPILIALAE